MRRSSMIQKGIKGSYFQVKTQKMICVLREDLQTDRLTDSLRDNNIQFLELLSQLKSEQSV